MLYRDLSGFVVGLLLTCASGISVATEQSTPVSYAKTIEALQLRYIDEVTAHQKYAAYAQQAEKEDYPNIAHLFRALAASEAIHAHNFKKILSELGVTPKPPQKREFPIAKTKKNIRHASTVEAEEIDKKYPHILKSIEAENHEQAILFITYAWKAEKQHREMILKIKKASKRFFGLLAGTIEGDPTRYYVCHVCGSTLTELPAKQCPICGHPAAEYKEVPGFPGESVW